MLHFYFIKSRLIWLQVRSDACTYCTVYVFNMMHCTPWKGGIIYSLIKQVILKYLSYKETIIDDMCVSALT